MKKTLFFLFLSQIIFAQKTYNFDYVLEYKTTKNDSIKVDLSYLINSKNNDFLLEIKSLDSTNYKINFTDRTSLFTYATLNKNAFDTAEKINVSCDVIFKFLNPFKYQTKNYDYFNLKDTLINDTLFFHCELKSNRSLKYQKRKNIHSLHLIIDKKSADFLPFLYQITSYEEWKKEKNIPNGKLQMLYYVNWENKITDKWILNKIIPIEKKLIIEKGCDKIKTLE